MKYNKALVTFFSASGVTEGIAKKLAKSINADLFEIIPKKLYSEADLDWTNGNSRSSVEMRNPSFRPELASNPSNIDDYDVVFVGFPIWWYTAPTIINTFLEGCDLSNKTLVPFATSGSSGYGKTNDSLIKSGSPTTKILNGKMLNGNPSEKILKDWVNSL